MLLGRLMDPVDEMRSMGFEAVREQCGKTGTDACARGGA